MKLVSVNVGLPRQVVWNGETVTTGIFKTPIQGHVLMRTLNLEGDQQADLTVHGGAAKAVYVYPAEHYEFWRTELPDRDLPWGSFGENFSTTGLLEEAVHIGDRLRIGSTEFVVTQPRLPCYKLGIKFGMAEIVKRFLSSRRSGFYLAVTKEGDVGAGDSIEFVGRDAHLVTVVDITRLYLRADKDLEKLRRAVQIEALPQDWRHYFAEQMEQQTNS
jgi:MOSC domain-containing protein YiiM